MATALVPALCPGTLLDEGGVYYWRFRAENACGISEWVGPFAFATLIDVCASFEALDVPLNITSSAAITVESIINVPISGTVSDVNITRIQGFHQFFEGYVLVGIRF